MAHNILRLGCKTLTRSAQLTRVSSPFTVFFSLKGTNTSVGLVRSILAFLPDYAKDKWAMFNLLTGKSLIISVALLLALVLVSAVLTLSSTLTGKASVNRSVLLITRLLVSAAAISAELLIIRLLVSDWLTLSIELTGKRSANRLVLLAPALQVGRELIGLMSAYTEGQAGSGEVRVLWPVAPGRAGQKALI